MKVWLKKNLREKIIEDSQSFLPLETGGMLIGYKDIFGNLVITILIDGGPDAIRLEDSFIPDGKFQQEKLEEFFHQSRGVLTYLGDWHSHPYSYPYMSNLDLKTIKKIAKYKSSKTPNPIFIIIGTSESEIKCWMYKKSKESIVVELPIELF